MPDGLLPDDLLLETLTDIVAGNVRRRRTWIRLGSLLVLFPLIRMLLFALEWKLEWPVVFFGLIVLGVFSAILLIPLLFSGPAFGTLLALDSIRERLLPNARPEQVAPLLTLSQAASALMVTERTRFEIDETLQRLLPRFHAVETLGPIHRKALRRLALQHFKTRPEITIAALLVLADTGDRSLRRYARDWADNHPEGRFREAAAEYLRATEKWA